MRDFLLFTYYAPIAAFGQVAVGEVRGSWERPGKSAILGLLAAGLGLARDDAEGQAALAEAYGYAVRTDAPGKPLSDYHTAQTAPRNAFKNGPPASRAEVLAASKINTILSRRAYRTDSLFTVALWEAAPSPHWPLVELAEALKHPHYQPYAGRKACPFALPLAPTLVQADTLGQAFAGRPPWPEDLPLDRFDDGEEPRKRLAGWSVPWSREVAYDAGAPAALTEGLKPIQSRQRRDRIADRPRWQFAWRDEAIASLPDASTEPPPEETTSAETAP